jgi:hypothetical protein
MPPSPQDARRCRIAKLTITAVQQGLRRDRNPQWQLPTRAELDAPVLSHWALDEE